MPRFSSPPFAYSQIFGLGCLLALGVAGIQSGRASSTTVTYDVRAKTRDNVTALTGAAKQGSFGSPALNDNGSVAYACVISGTGIGSLTEYSVIFRAKGKKSPFQLTLQSGVQKGYDSPFLASPPYVPELLVNDPRTIQDDFLINTSNSADIQPVPWTGRMLQISQEVALNNNNEIAFAGELAEDIETATFMNGALTNLVESSQNYSTIGLIIPDGATWTNINVVTYLEYFADILTRTTSLNATGAVPFSAAIEVTTDNFLNGILYRIPPTRQIAVATVQSTALGLPYFTTFSAFTDPVISSDNYCYVVANLSDTGAAYDGIWYGKNSNLQPIATIVSTAPGGGAFSAFDPTVGPSPNNNYVAFMANVTPPTVTNASPTPTPVVGAATPTPSPTPVSLTRGVFRYKKEGKSIITVAEVGAKAPGTGGTYADFTLASVNNRGDVAFLGTVQNGQKTFSAIWLSNPAGQKVHLIVREGQTLRVGGKNRTVSKLTFTPITGLNRKGWVAFTASFTNRTSAVIVAE